MSYCSASAFYFDTELTVSPFNFSGLVWFVCPDYVCLLTESVWLMLRGCRVGFVGCALWLGTSEDFSLYCVGRVLTEVFKQAVHFLKSPL